MGPVVLLILFALLVLLILPVWVFVKIKSFSGEHEALWARIRNLELETTRLRQQLQSSNTAATPAASSLQPPSDQAAAPSPVAATVDTPPTPPLIQPAPALSANASPPPIPAVSPKPVTTQISTIPPPLPQTARDVSVSWEQFMGAKLFAWLGGLAGFLAVAYFVKYSFEHDLIPPEVRVGVGFLLSAALIVGGLMMKAPRFRITAQVLCATGIVSLYAVTFACYEVYEFPFFGAIATFLLMTLITATAFLLAVRMNAKVIAILGLLGGFLTPVLLATGQDNPGGLFGFIALLDVGLIAVALHRLWFHLVPLAAIGTVVMQIGWATKFFEPTKAYIAVMVCLGFCALFVAAVEIGRRWQRSSHHLVGSAAALALVAFGFGFFFLTYSSIASRPGFLFGFIFAIDLLLLALVWRNETAARLEAISGGLVFAFLAIWTARHLTDELLSWALGAYLFFAVLHTAFPLMLQRTRPRTAPAWWSQVYPPLTLLLMVGPLLKSDEVTLTFWPALLLVDVVAIVLALLSASVTALGVVLVVTLAAIGLCIFRTSGSAIESVWLLWLIAGFSFFFIGAGLFIVRRLGPRLGQDADAKASKFFGNHAAQIPAFSALLPFALLIMMSQRLQIINPTPIFGLALFLGALIWGLSRLLTIEWLPLCGLIGTAALEYAWHARLFDRSNAALPLAWYAGFYALFAGTPFLFRRHFVSRTGPWAVSALSGIVHFPLVYTVVQQAWPNEYPGLLAAGFAVAPLLGLVAMARISTPNTPSRLNQLTWFGGSALLFVTLIIPLQFERQWITISWALEGVALLWLYQRVPHPGLRATGAVLLIVAFARLALNPAVLSYHPRSDTALINWYLYAYGITLMGLFLGARLLATVQSRVFGMNLSPVLNGLGIVLAFLLLNIEIADYFTKTGRVLTFEFGGNFARDVAYTVGWAFFALALLGVGIWKSARAARYAALALLGVTLLKLFFHDLAHLGQLYRVGALVVVAAVAILASMLYQRFTPSDEQIGRPKP